MMKKVFILLVSVLVLYSCGTTSKVTRSKPKSTHKAPATKKYVSGYSGKNSKKVNSILKNAERYIGTPYKYAGNTSAGFDCSGLVCKVFEENNVKLPRRSEDQSKHGTSVSTSGVKPGDLLFFATAGGSKVSHVGIVHSTDRGQITFIHSSTSKGVIVSSLNETYWNKAYLFARRVL